MPKKLQHDRTYSSTALNTDEMKFIGGRRFLTTEVLLRKLLFNMGWVCSTDKRLPSIFYNFNIHLHLFIPSIFKKFIHHIESIVLSVLKYGHVDYKISGTCSAITFLNNKHTDVTAKHTRGKTSRNELWQNLNSP